jgi:hypothetical protein
MRLLRREDDGGLTLAEFIGNIPRYAILSHTWGSDSDEISLKDLVENPGGIKKKKGYRKITFCLDQASRDDLEYVWIDTCCIDRSSSAELSEAINSMFRWYQEASRCYVYLSDVSSGNKTRQEFQNSRWFTRGWTLQELVAPASVEFFSLEGEPIGDRLSLLGEIAEVTGISVQVLRGHPLSDFSVTERMSWAAQRQTKREEDAAYSLLGIFDVQMPLLYGERREKALYRLHRTIQESMEHRPSDLSLAPATMQVVSASRDQRYLDYVEGSTTYVSDNQLLDAHQRVFDSLQFSQILERRHQIHEAYGDTYRWILESTSDRSHEWDDFRAWLSSPTESKRIYWIHGKPGSGKSTLMRFIDENISPHHFQPWARGKTILSAQYFFWNPGSKLQKTLAGLLRTLLLQLLEQQPLLIQRVIGQRKWAAALRPGKNSIEWTETELKHSLYQIIHVVRDAANIFLLIDGLDELNGSDDIREELIGFVSKISKSPNVKICVSSRPWNIFQDAFEGCLQLKLEDLTRDDIRLYVKERLYDHPRFQRMIQSHPRDADALVVGILRKAAGVFLWVCLVVKQLLHDLRDGCGIEKLLESLEDISSDLSHYFTRLMSSISSDQRKEASKMIQIVLYQEVEYASMLPLRLVDLYFIGQDRPDFVLDEKFQFQDFDPTDRQALEFQLESICRRLSSRCMGLIEHSPPRPLASNDDDDDGPLQALDSNVDFLHRSCRDFLSTPEILNALQRDTNGSYDAQMFLLNARISQFISLAKHRGPDEHVLGLASHILCSLARPSIRGTRASAALAATIQPTLEAILQTPLPPLQQYRYIHDSIQDWHTEQSSFLTLAIDFNLDAYVTQHLTPTRTATKRGRPILDYILRPRFPEIFDTEPSADAVIKNTNLLTLALRMGADPNEAYGSASVWALFLSFVADVAAAPEANSMLFPECSDVLEQLVRAGAATLLPRSWLRAESHSWPLREIHHWPAFSTEMGEVEDLFEFRWPGVGAPLLEAPDDMWYTVGSLLQGLRSDIGIDVARLRRAVYSREVERT